MSDTQTVHPRACGEHASAGHTNSSSSGSSPRVRGTRACPDRGVTWWPVHPRACGEHLIHIRNSCVGPGSSPRVRGTP